MKAFNTSSPHIYFQTLRDIGALHILFPEVDALFGVPQPEKHHPEIDSGIHTLLVLSQAKKLTNKASEPESVLFAALCHDLGKALTPKDILPHHYGHEYKGVAPTEALANRLKVPVHIKEFAKLVAEFHTLCHKIMELRPETVIKLFNKLDVWRKPLRFFDFLLVCEADSKGRLGFEEREYPQAAYAKQLYTVANKVDVQKVIADGFEKENIRIELDKRREYAIKKFKQIKI